MNEQEFVYGKLKFLTESVDVLAGVLEKQGHMIEQLTGIIVEMQSVEYAKKQSNIAKNADIEDKIKLMKNMMNKQK